MLGIRIKSFHVETKARALRTLGRFLSQAKLPKNFVVTLPKVTAAEQVAELIEALRPYPGVRIEIMVETPESIFILPKLLEAAQGKCIAAHFGAYDYTSSLGITAAHQTLQHPACEFARSMMLASLAGTGFGWRMGPRISCRYRQRSSNWKLHYDNVPAPHNGFYQGWDLHPAQIPARLVAVHAFFRRGWPKPPSGCNFRDQAEQATPSVRSSMTRPRGVDAQYFNAPCIAERSAKKKFRVKRVSHRTDQALGADGLARTSFTRIRSGRPSRSALQPARTTILSSGDASRNSRTKARPS
jgi:hypothetical protein